MKIVFATANPHKVAEVQQLLGKAFDIITPQQLGYAGDIPETGATLRENALQKARFVFARFGLPCFADDTGLEIDALDGAPGVYSARYAGDGRDAAANLRRVLRELHGADCRTARFRCVIALIAGGRERLFEGVTEGDILAAPRGDGGFGYDPVFRPAGGSRTFAEMPPSEKNRLSHRGKAVAQLVHFLQTAAVQTSGNP